MHRLRCRFLPGSDFFVVYREEHDVDDDTVDRSLTLKLTFRYDGQL